MRVLWAALEKLLRRQSQILRNHTTIAEMIEATAQVLDQIRDYEARIDEATNAIAVRIQSLIDKVNAGTATSERIAAILQPEVDRLTELGKEPSTPAEPCGYGVKSMGQKALDRARGDFLSLRNR